MVEVANDIRGVMVLAIHKPVEKKQEDHKVWDSKNVMDSIMAGTPIIVDDYFVSKVFTEERNQVV